MLSNDAYMSIQLIGCEFCPYYPDGRKLWSEKYSSNFFGVCFGQVGFDVDENKQSINNLCPLDVNNSLFKTVKNNTSRSANKSRSMEPIVVVTRGEDLSPVLDVFWLIC